jgi:hypothetical protein
VWGRSAFILSGGDDLLRDSAACITVQPAVTHPGYGQKTMPALVVKKQTGE